ncbi:DNA replication/repair protein RecF [Thiolinea disciformis]|uniref:DNA replication/repair protein RecF n=1 Tax=Thiolinea disciformis TaxID=125614 RepID=UPI000369867E|nr:DNA replication and repair protein RecF [Thiolinea disciformis]
MWLESLSVENCRALQQVSLDLSPQFNVFSGDNGSGKSSLIEALCILSRGRSFRTPRIAEVIRQDATALTIAGRVKTDDLQTYPLGIHKTTRQTRIRINHQDIYQQAELSRHLPVTVIHPDTIDLAGGSPVQRRALLDWLAFYAEPEFHRDWRAYQRILKQRNSCLRELSQRYALPYWTNELIQLQPKFNRYRQQALLALQESLKNLAVLLEPLGCVQLYLSTGFPSQVDNVDADTLEQFFKEKQDMELRHGVSLYGAHRGDLMIHLDEQAAARTASRGQLKILGIALLLAQSNAITQDITKRGIIAIDDLASELDSLNQQRLYQVLSQSSQQLMITGTRPPPDHFLPNQTRLFHVEHGHISLATALY